VSRLGRAAAAVAAWSALAAAWPVSAQDASVPLVFRSVQSEKGEWKGEVVSHPGGPGNIVCAENPFSAVSYERRPGPSGCSRRWVKDTADAAVYERVCPRSATTVVFTRDGNSVLVDVSSTSSSGTQAHKWRFTPLGACRNVEPAKKDKAA